MKFACFNTLSIVSLVYLAGNLYAAATTSLASKRPIGILNQGNMCFASSLIQTLYNLPAIRNTIINNWQKSPALLNTASVFVRLGHPQITSAISIKNDFYYYLKSATNDTQFTIHRNGANDPHELFEKLFFQDPVIASLFGFTETSQLFLGNEPISEPTVTLSNHVRIIYMSEHISGTSGSLTLTPDILINDPSESVLFKPDGYRKDIKCRKEVSNSDFSPFIFVYCNRYSGDKNSKVSFLSNLRLNVSLSMNIHGSNYDLRAIIYYGGGHYVARVRIGQHIWHFNDSRTPYIVKNFEDVDGMIKHIVIYGRPEFTVNQAQIDDILKNYVDIIHIQDTLG